MSKWEYFLQELKRIRTLKVVSHPMCITYAIWKPKHKYGEEYETRR
jgi:hypothetical protein